MGLPLTMMKLSYFFAYCPDTTGWLVIADADFSFSICPNYMPADENEQAKPYFKYSTLTTVADLSTGKYSTIKTSSVYNSYNSVNFMMLSSRSLLIHK